MRDKEVEEEHRDACYRSLSSQHVQNVVIVIIIIIIQSIVRALEKEDTPKSTFVCVCWHKSIGTLVTHCPTIKVDLVRNGHRLNFSEEVPKYFL